MRLVVAMTGAAGAIIGVRLLQALRDLNVESHLVVSRWARATIKETSYRVQDVMGLASVSYGPEDQGAAISSGSFRMDGMVIAPCSMKTVAGGSHGAATGTCLLQPSQGP